MAPTALQPALGHGRVAKAGQTGRERYVIGVDGTAAVMSATLRQLPRARAAAARAEGTEITWRSNRRGTTRRPQPCLGAVTCAPRIVASAPRGALPLLPDGPCSP